MKRLILLIAIMFSSLALANPNWITSYQEGLDLAKKEHKMAIVMLSQEHCPACNYMKSKVFIDQPMVDELSKHYVWILLDTNSKQDEAAIESLPDYFGTPTFFFVDDQGKQLMYGKIEGKVSVSEFKEKALDIVAAN